MAAAMSGCMFKEFLGVTESSSILSRNTSHSLHATGESYVLYFGMSVTTNLGTSSFQTFRVTIFGSSVQSGGVP